MKFGKKSNEMSCEFDEPKTAMYMGGSCHLGGVVIETGMRVYITQDGKGRLHPKTFALLNNAAKTIEVYQDDATDRNDIVVYANSFLKNTAAIKVAGVIIK